MSSIDLPSALALGARAEPFVLMAKSARGAAAAKLISDATTAPGVFVFGELLDALSAAQLAGTPHGALLDLFAYGTYTDYTSNPSAYPALGAAQVTKLKLLSVVSAAMEHRILPYADLITALDAPSVRALEDLVIDAVYQGLLEATLDQQRGVVEVAYTVGRDVRPEALPELLAGLQAWSSTTASVLGALDDRLAAAAQTRADAREERDQWESGVQATMKELQDKRDKKKAPTRGGNLGTLADSAADSTANDAMDIDERDGAASGRGKGRRPPASETTKTRKRNRF
ncbi:hypothetical protein BD626DRAFT_496523 [Schizophyllum amplum]|uniref:PCI domain-containing protein n=1 Tax=Schizophyllum amplum TaxID=97359 RepID=A0A550CDB3_9AGAR|nr:hypothetical protein BD626DRAFT_496523 [Auriculariopsis ampla]